MKNIYKDKIILVTGGLGSIGSEIVRQVLKLEPKQVRVFDNRETEAFHMQNELMEYDNLRFLMGDIRNKDRLMMAMENVDFVFHASALKHVPLCEFNPFEAVTTNVYGTQNVIEAALRNNVEKVVNISTDKVTNTVNTMGATKLLAERLIASAQYFKGRKETLFSSVRFGNVMGSRGSVIEVFEKQIKNDAPLTITDPEMTRFIMSIPQAVKLVLSTSQKMQGGEIFILKMPVFKLIDLVEVLKEELSIKHNKDPTKIEVKQINLRPGERMFEDLMTEEESKEAIETDESFVVLSEINLPHLKRKLPSYAKNKKPVKEAYSSKNSEPMSKEQIRNLIKKENLI